VWNISSVLFVVFLIWAYVPDYLLKSQGLSYFPDKTWALILPSWLCVTAILGISMYAASGLYYSHPRESFFTMQDRATALAHPEGIEQENGNNDRVQKQSEKHLVRLTKTPSQITADPLSALIRQN